MTWRIMIVQGPNRDEQSFISWLANQGTLISVLPQGLLLSVLGRGKPILGSLTGVKYTKA